MPRSPWTASTGWMKWLGEPRFSQASHQDTARAGKKEPDGPGEIRVQSETDRFDGSCLLDEGVTTETDQGIVLEFFRVWIPTDRFHHCKVSSSASDDSSARVGRSSFRPSRSRA